MVDYDFTKEMDEDEDSGPGMSYGPGVAVPDDGKAEVRGHRGSPGGLSLLAKLQERIKTEIENPPILLALSTRDGISLEYDTTIMQEDLELWYRRSGARLNGDAKRLNTLRLATIVVMQRNTGIWLDGERATDDQGEPLIVANQAVWEVTGAPDPYNGVRAFYGRDSELFAHANRIMDEAGFSEDKMLADEEGNNPLRGSTKRR